MVLDFNIIIRLNTIIKNIDNIILKSNNFIIFIDIISNIFLI